MAHMTFYSEVSLSTVQWDMGHVRKYNKKQHTKNMGFNIRLGKAGMFLDDASGHESD